MAPKLSSLEKIFLSIFIPAILIIVAVLGHSFLNFQELTFSPEIINLLLVMSLLVSISVSGLAISIFSRLVARKHGRHWWRRLLRRSRRRRFTSGYDV